MLLNFSSFNNEYLSMFLAITWCRAPGASMLAFGGMGTYIMAQIEKTSKQKGVPFFHITEF